MHIDVKETIWHRLVINESYEAEVTKMLYEGKSYEDVVDFLYGKGKYIGVEYLFGTTQGIEQEQNGGENTIELIDNDYNTVWGNNGDNKFILNPDEKTVEKILRACWRNDGFCPCLITSLQAVSVVSKPSLKSYERIISSSCFEQKLSKRTFFENSIINSFKIYRNCLCLAFINYIEKVFNVKTLSKEDQDKIKKALLSKETTDNPAIFSPKTSKKRGLFLKENENVGFVETDNEWYEQIRNIK